MFFTILAPRTIVCDVFIELWLLPLASIPFPSFGFSSPGSDGKTGFIVIFLFAFCLHILSSRTTLVCVKKLERNNKRRLQECPCDVKMLFLGSKKENERNHKNNTFERSLGRWESWFLEPRLRSVSKKVLSMHDGAAAPFQAPFLDRFPIELGPLG